MARKRNSTIISVAHPICCGYDIHKDMVSAYIFYEHMGYVNDRVVSLGKRLERGKTCGSRQTE